MHQQAVLAAAASPLLLLLILTVAETAYSDTTGWGGCNFPESLLGAELSLNEQVSFEFLDAQRVDVLAGPTVSKRRTPFQCVAQMGATYLLHSTRKLKFPGGPAKAYMCLNMFIENSHWVTISLLNDGAHQGMMDALPVSPERQLDLASLCRNLHA